MIRGLRHTITGIWSGEWRLGRVLHVEADVVYIHADGTQTPPLPVTSTVRFEGDRIKDYRVLADVSPVVEAPSGP